MSTIRHLPPSSVVPLHPLRVAIARAMRHLDALRPTILAGLGDDDFDAFLADLMRWAEIADDLTLAFGEYAKSRVGCLSRADIDRHFRDQLKHALQGNATFVLCEAFRASLDQWSEPDDRADD